MMNASLAHAQTNTGSEEEQIDLRLLFLEVFALGMWCVYDATLLSCVFQMESITNMLLERGSGSFSCRSKPADCGYGKYIPIMCSPWSQRPCCFSHCFRSASTL